jgi:hypothetical protein
MSTTDTARASAWALMTEWSISDGDDDAIAGCLLELRARVERLEQAQQPEAEAADPGTDLVRRVQDAIDHAPDLYEARAVILCIADWLHERTRYGAEVLRREVGR